MTKKHMHKGIFRTNHSSTIVYWKVLSKRTQLANWGGTRKLPIGTKLALFCVWKHIYHKGIILSTSLTSNFEFYASIYPFVSTFEY